MSIYKALVGTDVDVLKIDPMEILLPGYDRGFIGGCGGFIKEDLIYLTGNIKGAQKTKIFEFVQKHNVRFIFNDANDLIDIGGIVPLA